MTPPSPEDSSLPPRQRQSVESFAKNSREEDLWDLPDLPADDGLEAAPQVTVLPRTSLPSAPPPTLPFGTAASPPTVGDKAEAPILPVATTPRNQSSQSSNVARLGRTRIYRDFQPPEHPGTSPSTGAMHPLEDTFDSLEDWDFVDEPPEDNSNPTPAPGHQAAAHLPPASDASASPRQQLPTMPDLAATNPPATTADASPEPQTEVAPPADPAPKPVSLRPHLKLSKLERISLISLAVMLLAGGFWVYQNSLSPLLRQAAQAQDIPFPVRGSNVTVSKVVTYWRRPLKTANQVEAVRRGVVLIPVVEITLEGGPGAIRALIHNDTGTTVGDPITRQIDGATTLILPTTDGFEDLSMHAAYRTGQIKAWTVHIFEAPSINASGKDFKKLLELPISSEKH